MNDSQQIHVLMCFRQNLPRQTTKLQEILSFNQRLPRLGGLLHKIQVESVPSWSRSPKRCKWPLYKQEFWATPKPRPLLKSMIWKCRKIFVGQLFLWNSRKECLVATSLTGLALMITCFQAQLKFSTCCLWIGKVFERPTSHLYNGLNRDCKIVLIKRCGCCSNLDRHVCC